MDVDGLQMDASLAADEDWLQRRESWKKKRRVKDKWEEQLLSATRLVLVG
jgi:hypothetical protein